jgi:hypothetical protein
MYLVRTVDGSALERIASNIDLLDGVSHCDLPNLNSLTLVELHSGSAKWIATEPVVFDEESGIAVFEFADEGVAWMKDNAEQLAEFGADPESVRAFAMSQGSGNVYAIDTF